MSLVLALAGAFAVLWALAYHRAAAPLWIGCCAVGLAAATAYFEWTGGLLALVWALFVAAALLLAPGPLRRALVSRPVLERFRRILPEVSRTEKEALEAGTVWWEGEIFSGRPDWSKLLGYPRPQLSAEERAFIEGPLAELCGMLDDWRITHELCDLPPEVWRFMRERGFFGLIIPREYGGLGFSALAHSEIVMRLSTRSGTGAVSVMVPNSLGPAELLLHYGTAAQKDYYLPRLAKGLEIPCFALTSPEAGSDAAGIPDYGIVCRGEWQGRPDVLGMRLTWDKRYVTLAPIATLLGVAFRLYDPDRLLGSRPDLGITLALIPASTPGVHTGRRHLPLGTAFMNGPTTGSAVFVPIDTVIGGVEYAGQGWRMLMNCLAAGRAISLPANAVGIAKLCTLTTGAYARVREQFDLPIGRFEGVEEALVRIAANTYIMDAARTMTAGAIDLGEKPAVASAIVKYHLTERGRQVINDAMDVHAGKGICMGPRNYLARAYEQTPIVITVEGANILTRCMIIFGQGAIRCHPYVLREISAAAESDRTIALKRFDAAFFGHFAFMSSNKARALWMGLTAARLVSAPGDRDTRYYYRQLTRMSSAFALAADIAMLKLGGALKRRERLTGRLADILSELYLASSVLKRYEDDGRPATDLPLVHWALQDALVRIQDAFDALFRNLPGRFTAAVVRFVVFPWGRAYAAPRDRLAHAAAGLVLAPGAARERLTSGVYVSAAEDDPLADLEKALAAAIVAEPAEQKLRAARRARGLSHLERRTELAAAQEQGLISAAEAQLVERARALRRKAITVDDFPRHVPGRCA